MPIVLAIEPDRRQAAHLTAIVRHQVGAELIIADTTEGALDAIGDRVPDLVLVPALLSPIDDAALAAALKVIAAAAHVRTLTIPVLASGTARAATGGGMLAKWRRSREEPPAPVGCDPAVFGEQISTYLQEAAAERAEIEDDAIEFAASPAVVPDVVPAVVAPVLMPSVVTHEVMAAAAAEPIASGPIAFRDETETVDEPWADDSSEEPLIDLSDELADLSDESGDELFDGEHVGVYTISADADDHTLEAFDLLSTTAEPRPIEPAAEPLFEAFIETSDEPDEPPRADIEPWVPMYLTPGRMWPAMEGMPAETPAPRAEQPDWIELVASLRQDLERRRTDPPSADPLAARPSDGAEADVRQLVKKQKPPVRKQKPMQDEWGFFDPEQCGFSTLLAKLEEITDDGARG